MSIDQLFRKAHSKHLQGKHDAAARLYREVLRIKPNHLDSNYLLGTLYAENGELEEAQRHLAIADNLNPASPYIKVNLGNICMIQGEFETARRYFTDAIALKNDLSQAHFGLGNILENLDSDYDSAFKEYQKAVDLSPNDPMIFHAIGKALTKAGNHKALEYFARAHRLNPKLKDIQKDTGLAALRFGKTKEAARHLKIAHMEDPDDVQVSYHLCVAEGREPAEELRHKFVQEEFNSFANSFDHTLVNKLGYDAPTNLIKFMTENLSSRFHFSQALDLGCGTGLFGIEIREHVDRLEGIDLSGKMLEIARNRGCYDRLHHGEIIETMRSIDMTFDIFSASDVIVYFGDLDPLFESIKEKADSQAIFVFSTESFAGDTFVLQESGRYAHSVQYISSVSEKYGCSIIATRQIPIRKEGGNWIMGDLYIVRIHP